MKNNRSLLVFQPYLSIVALIPLLLCGCIIKYNKEIPPNSSLWGKYVCGSEYEITRDVFYIQLVDDPPRRFALIPEEEFDKWKVYRSPGSIAAWKSNTHKSSAQHSADVRGIVLAGTKIRTSKLVMIHDRDFIFGRVDRLILYAEIINGKFANKLVAVDILALSTKLKDRANPFVFMPNSDVLRMVKAGNNS